MFQEPFVPVGIWVVLLVVTGLIVYASTDLKARNVLKTFATQAVVSERIRAYARDLENAFHFQTTLLASLKGAKEREERVNEVRSAEALIKRRKKEFWAVVEMGREWGYNTPATLSEALTFDT